MPQAIGSAIKAVWVWATTTTLGSVASAVALSTVTSKLFGPKVPGGLGLSNKSVMSRTSTAFRQIVYGAASVSGPIVYNNVSGPDNENLWFVVALAEGQSTDLVSVWLDGNEIPAADIDWSPGVGGADGTGTGNVTTAKYVGENSATSARIRYYLGDPDQPVSGALDAAFTDINSTHRGRGVTHVICEFVYVPDTEKVWDGGPPRNIRAVIRGRKVYDPRLDSTNGGSGPQRYSDPSTWEWSQSPPLCLADYLTQIMGVDPATTIDWPSIAAAADVCDATVSVPGGSQARFTCNGALSLGSTHKQNLDAIASSCSGRLTYAQGKYKFRASVWEAPVLTITEDDLQGGVSVRGGAPESERGNVVRGVFVDPSRQYEVAEFPHVINPVYLAQDNNVVIPQDLNLPMTNDAYMAQRIGYRELEQFQNQILIDLPLKKVGARITAGDVILADLPSYGWGGGKAFRVVEWTRRSDGSFLIAGREDDSSDYVDPLVGEYKDPGDSSVTFKDTIVPAPSGLTATPTERGVRLDWSSPASRLYDQILIYAAEEGQERDAATLIAQVKDSPYTDVITENFRTKNYWIRARNYLGELSIFAPNTQTTTASAAKIAPPVSITPDPDISLSDGFGVYYTTVDKDGPGGTPPLSSSSFDATGGANGTPAIDCTIGFEAASAVLIDVLGRYRLNAGAFKFTIRYRSAGTATGIGNIGLRATGYAAATGGASVTQATVDELIDATNGAWVVKTFSIDVSDADTAQFWEFSVEPNNGLTDGSFSIDIDSIFISPVEPTYGTQTVSGGKILSGRVPESTDAPSATRFLNELGSFEEPPSGGGSIGQVWRYDSSTSPSDPGSGKFRFNDTNPQLATTLYINDEADNKVDFSVLFAVLKVGDRIYLQNREDANEALLVSVTSTTDNIGWWTITFTVEDGNGTSWSNNRFFGIQLLLGSSGGGLVSFAGRTDPDVIPQQSDYDSFFLTPAEADAAYVPLPGVTDFNGRTGAITPLQADYDSFFLTQAEGDARYLGLTAQAADSAALGGVAAANWLRRTIAQTVSGAQTHTAIPSFNGGSSGSLPPFNVDSTFEVANLNAALVGGFAASEFARSSVDNLWSIAQTFNANIQMGSGDEILLDNGTAVVPALAFLSDTNTGLFRGGENQLAVATGGAERAEFHSQTESDSITSLDIKHRDGVSRSAGLATMPVNLFTSNFTIDAADWHKRHKHNGTVGATRSITFNTEATAEANAVMWVQALNGPVQLVAGTMQLRRYRADGSPATGTFTLPRGGWVTICKNSSTEADVVGVGL